MIADKRARRGKERQAGFVAARRAHVRHFRAAFAQSLANRADVLFINIDDDFLDRFKGVSTRRPHSYLMWFKWLHEATRVGDRTSIMREQLEDRRYGKI